jgi:predicted metal-dependent phosphoesterase TrpH
MTLLRADFHTHTIFSFDSMVDPQEYIRRCVNAGVNCVAVTEHNNIDGALYLREIAPFKVIVAEEIRTREGEIIGFFLEEEVPAGLSPEETVERIKSQGGLVGTPHPFDPFRQGLGEAALRRIAKDIDVIEAFNARIHLARHNERAAAFAREHDLAVSAGTDAHSPWELGRAYIEMPDFDTPQQFLSSLREGRLVGRTASRLVHAFSTAEKLRRRLGLRRKLPSVRAAASRA